MELEIKWNKPPKEIVDEKTRGKQGLLWLGNEFRKLMDEYVPSDTGELSTNVQVNVEGNKATVHYMSPYAHYQYNGILFVDPVYNVGAFTNGQGKYWSRPGIAKKSAGRKLKHSTGKHSKARSQWDKPARKTQLPRLVAAFQTYIKG